MSKESGSEKLIDSENTFKILIATDIHLGYEQSKKRGSEMNDSFTTFEEILQYGKQHEVDFVLLGGDLFHDTKPSQTCVLKCMDLLRKYCLGSRENKIEFLSDPEVVFNHCPYKVVNYEDPNLNVSMPVFSIHGNHDDPNFGAVGSMDLLAVSGLVNYFGKWTDLTRIKIPPLIMKKGESHLALYGLSYINDQRLSRLFRDLKVDLLRAKEIPECFNILVLHQNRVKHGEYAYIPENAFPNFLNLVLWGHEHECRITPEFVAESKYFITQPGSSVATSLCEAEAKPKHVGILHVNKAQFMMKKLKLKTVRPFIFDNLLLRDFEIQRNYTKPLCDSVYDFVDHYIENELMPNAAKLLTGHPDQPLQPLLRLRIFYSNQEEMFETMRLAQKYCDEVANPMEMILFRKDKDLVNRSKSSELSTLIDDNDLPYLFDSDDDDKDWSLTVQGGIKKVFDNDANKNLLTVLTVNGLNEALHRYVNNADTDAFRDIVKHQMKKTVQHLENCSVTTTDSICDEIKRFRDNRNAKQQEERDEVLKVLDNSSRKVRKEPQPLAVKDTNQPRASVANSESGSGGSEEELNIALPKPRGRGSRRGTGARGAARGGRGRAKVEKKNPLDISVTHKTSTTTSKRKPEQSTLQQFVSSQRKGSSDIFFDNE